MIIKEMRIKQPILIVLLVMLMTSPTFASIMNLNSYMPTQLQDASPIPKNSFDAQYSAQFEKRPKDVLVTRPNVRYGLTNDIQLEAQSTMYSGGDEHKSGETDLDFLYRVVKGKNIPSVSVSPVFVIPNGKSQQKAELEFQFNVTQTLRGTPDDPLTEVHFNYVARKNKNRRSGDRGTVQNMVFGVSHTLSEKIALIVDYSLQEETEQLEVVQVAECGLHMNLGKGMFLGFSYAQGFGDSNLISSYLLGLEKQFGP